MKSDASLVSSLRIGLSAVVLGAIVTRKQPDVLAVVVSAYLGMSALSLHGRLRLEERRDAKERIKLQQEKHELELQLKRMALVRDQALPSLRRSQADGSIVSELTGSYVAPILPLSRKNNPGGPEPSGRAG